MARAGCTYYFFPTVMDRLDHRTRGIKPGTLVRVIPASGLGVSGRLPSKFAYIELLDRTVIGMCCSASLISRAEFKKHEEYQQALAEIRGDL